HFFQHYKDLERGKWVTIVKWLDGEGRREARARGDFARPEGADAGKSQAKWRINKRPTRSPPIESTAETTTPSAARPLCSQERCRELLHHQHRAPRELHDAVGAAADHAVVQRRMAGGADDEEIDLELGRVSDDGAHRVSRDDVGLQFHSL